MAKIIICDRCRKELTDRRTIINLKPIKHILNIDVFKVCSSNVMQRTSNHSFELCDDCANKLGEFLNYTGPEEVEEI